MNVEHAPQTARVRAMNVSSEAEEFAPLGVYHEGTNWNPVEKVIFERRSIRVFKKEPLPRGVIRRILEAGRFAPSAGNSQPWPSTKLAYYLVGSPSPVALSPSSRPAPCRTRGAA